VIDDESLVKTRTNTCLSDASAVPSYSVPQTGKINSLRQACEISGCVQVQFCFKFVV
jgi:hypothetical protein